MTETWIGFLKQSTTPNRKTAIWEVYSKEAKSRLGEVRWFGRWRCYGFFPEAGTVFERQCLRDIADFCERETIEHRANNQKAKLAHG